MIIDTLPPICVFWTLHSISPFAVIITSTFLGRLFNRFWNVILRIWVFQLQQCWLCYGQPVSTISAATDTVWLCCGHRKEWCVGTQICQPEQFLNFFIRIYYLNGEELRNIHSFMDTFRYDMKLSWGFRVNILGLRCHYFSLNLRMLNSSWTKKKNHITCYML